jgi:hypothetical protein
MAVAVVAVAVAVVVWVGASSASLCSTPHLQRARAPTCTTRQAHTTPRARAERTCGLTLSLGGGSQMHVKPSRAHSGTLALQSLYQLNLQLSQLNACARGQCRRRPGCIAPDQGTGRSTFSTPPHRHTLRHTPRANHTRAQPRPHSHTCSRTSMPLPAAGPVLVIVGGAPTAAFICSAMSSAAVFGGSGATWITRRAARHASMAAILRSSCAAASCLRGVARSGAQCRGAHAHGVTARGARQHEPRLRGAGTTAHPHSAAADTLQRRRALLGAQPLTAPGP